MGCHAKKIRQFTDYQFAFTPVENIDKSKGGGAYYFKNGFLSNKFIKTNAWFELVAGPRTGVQVE